VSEPYRRYCRLERGYLDVAGISDDALLLLAWLHQSPNRDVVPGLLRMGPGALAEEKGWELRKVRRRLGELSGHVLVNEPERVMFILGAIRADPPRNVNQMVAFARQIAQMPFCSGVAAACAEVDGCVEKSEKSLIDKWRTLNCYANRSGDASGNSCPQIQIHTHIPIQIHTPEKQQPAARAASLPHELSRAEYEKEVEREQEAHLRKLGSARW
jgi:hypothetical protein